MVAIHHATRKRAEASSIVLEDQGDVVRALHAPSGRHVEAEEPKTALAAAILIKRLVVEYPKITIGVNGDSITAAVNGEDLIEPIDMEDYNEDETYAAILDAYAEMGEMGEMDDEQESESTGGLVGHKYRVMYRERGNPSHCGDWLAKFMEGMFQGVAVVEGVSHSYFDTRAFTRFLVLNGVALSGKWAALPSSGQKGWIGRYRMNGRQRLEIEVAINGRVTYEVVDEHAARIESVEVPTEYLSRLRENHAKALLKRAKMAPEG